MLARTLICLGLLSFAARAIACPFCEATAPTWLQSVRDADAAVIATVTKVIPPNENDPVPLSRLQYQVAELLNAKTKVVRGEAISVESLEAPMAGAQGLLIASGDDELSWSTLCELTTLRAQYFAAARKLTEQGVERWQHFYRYLEHSDEELAEDAYGEFAGASFAEVKAFAKHADRAQLWRWIESEKTPESRRGLYYTLLGCCGKAEDAKKLASMMSDAAKRPPGALSALIACYLSLEGEPGLRAVEQHYLAKQSRATDSDVQAVIAAIRFHGEEQHVLKRERLAVSFRMLLSRTALAGDVIPDLARWEDWQSLPQLVALFRQTNEESAWLRIPIVAYLKVCPLDEAKHRLEELRKLDPKAIEQAEALSLFGSKLRPVSDAANEGQTDE